MEIDAFLSILDRVNRADTIEQVVALLTEVDNLQCLDIKERRIIDECLTESLEIAILHGSMGDYFAERYGGNIDVGEALSNAAPETVVINGAPVEVYRPNISRA